MAVAMTCPSFTCCAGRRSCGTLISATVRVELRPQPGHCQYGTDAGPGRSSASLSSYSNRRRSDPRIGDGIVDRRLLCQVALTTQFVVDVEAANTETVIKRYWLCAGAGKQQFMAHDDKRCIQRNTGSSRVEVDLIVDVVVVAEAEVLLAEGLLARVEQVAESQAVVPSCEAQTTCQCSE